MTTQEDNPFRPGGDLSKEADDVLRSSTINRTTVEIKDPIDVHANGNGDPSILNGGRAVHFSGSGSAQTNHEAVAGDTSGPIKSIDGEPLTAEVTADMIKPTFQEVPGQVEHVTIEKSKGCCTLL